jgi:hypothetical protein
MVSPTNVAYFASPQTYASIFSGNLFDFNSAYLTAESTTNTVIRVQGLVGTSVTYDNTYTIKTTEPTLLNFNYVAIDTVRFLQTNNIDFLMDNATVNIDCAGVCKNYVTAWGCDPVCPYPSNLVAIAAGQGHILFLKEDSTVAACGMTVPDGLTNVIAVSGGDSFSLALKSDGTVVAWGTNTDGQTDVPADLTNAIAIAAGANHSLALRADNTVVGWGGTGGAAVPNGLTNVVAIAGGRGNSLALKADGTVVGWGAGNLAGLPALSNIVAIGGGDNCCVISWAALQSDGRLAWGNAPSGGTTYPSDSNFVAIATSRGFDGHIDFFLKNDGTVLGSGYDFCSRGGPVVPPTLPTAAAIAAGDTFGLALNGAGPPALGPPLLSFGRGTNGFEVSVPTRTGRVYRLEYKNALDDSDWIGSPLVAGNGRAQVLSDPLADVAQRFYRVRHW